jgi:hypothetical protein
VVTPAGRQSFIGVEIECKQCNEEQVEDESTNLGTG